MKEFILQVFNDDTGEWNDTFTYDSENDGIGTLLAARDKAIGDILESFNDDKEKGRIKDFELLVTSGFKCFDSDLNKGFTSNSIMHDDKYNTFRFCVMVENNDFTQTDGTVKAAKETPKFKFTPKFEAWYYAIYENEY